MLLLCGDEAGFKLRLVTRFLRVLCLPLLRDVLNRIRWHPAERHHNFMVIITDRIVREGIRTLETTSITEVHASYFLYEESGELKHIPLHHVVRVIDQTSGDILWEKRRRPVK
jgi:uncharacterized protein (UPF0248 family)